MQKFLIFLAIFSSFTLTKAATCASGCPKSQILLFYSNTSTMAQGPAKPIPGPASLVNFIHSAWLKNQINAKWISDAPDTLVTPGADTVRYFTIVINLPCAPTKAQAGITADNSFWTYVNGQAVATCSDATERNFNIVFACDLTSYLVQGDNIIEWKVRNWPQSGGNYQTNPTGLMYTLNVTI